MGIPIATTLAEKQMFVVAAQVAAHLHNATKIAKHLSLTAKNARAITARAGQTAAGFTAITGFIQELATTTISLSQKIDHIAVEIAMHATQMERTKHANEALELVQVMAKDAKHVLSINPFLHNARQAAIELTQKFEGMLAQLTTLVEQTRLQIRSAEVISTMSKIEASKSGSFERQLKVIADNIFSAALKIRKELECAEHLLPQTQR